MNNDFRPVYPVVLVSCGKSKQQTAAPAKDLYTSERFKEARRFAERFAQNWFIISAKHGLVSPEATLNPYDFSIDLLNPDQKRAWADEVTKALLKHVPGVAHAVILATDSYSDPLFESLLRASVNATAPLRSLSEEAAGHLMARINRQPTRLFDHINFYHLLDRLQQLQTQMATFNSLVSKHVAKAGVYYFFEESEYTRFHPVARLRVVRIGTHGVSKGSKSQLWQRLRTHRGNDDGSGSHRSSIFRLHVGRAVLIQSARQCETWGIGEQAASSTRAAEASIEQEVSTYISSLRVMHLPVLDASSADSDRSYIEMNSIALLTGGGPIDPPSANWLGNVSPTQSIRDSGMWNVNYVGELYDQTFLSVFRELIERYESGCTTSESLAPSNWRTTMQRGGIGQQQLF